VFLDKRLAAARASRSLLCVGQDPDPALAPPALVEQSGWVARFNAAIVEATADLVCAYKPNLAFYEALGRDGWDALRATLASIPRHVPVILDGKRGDIGNTARAYATALFVELGADAATVSPYLGRDSLEPYLAYPDRAVFVLCKTSNAGAGDFQDLQCTLDGERMPLYQVVATRARDWGPPGAIGLVVGATYPSDVAAVRAIAPVAPLLLPGVGAQAGDLSAAVQAAVDARGERAIVNAARQVLYAASGDDWLEAARRAAEELRRAINLARGLAA
jgi:orotidine-5'-phosphate decarboxylase